MMTISMIRIYKLNRHILATTCLFESLGFVFNREKSVLHPCQKLASPGFILDSVLTRVYLTEERVEKVVSACHNLLKENGVFIRDVDQTIDFLISCRPALQHGPLFYRTIEIDKNR